MAAVIPRIPIHLTQRAYYWLTQWTALYHGTYPMDYGQAQCGAKDLLDQNVNACTVGDVRAHYISNVTGNHAMGKFRVEFDPNTRQWVAVHNVKLPTCEHCLVLLDKALETCPPKYGKYYAPGLGGIVAHAWILTPEEIERRAKVMTEVGNYNRPADVSR